MVFAKKSESSNAKAGLKTAQTGTPVPEKDFSSKKKETKAVGNGKPEKGSAATAKSLPMPAATSVPVAPEKKTWEGSSEDWSKDYAASKRKGMTTEQYEDTAEDRVSDAAGERRFRADESNKVQHASEYKQGVSAFKNQPKASHGYGHSTSSRDGHLRNSGHGGAHRIGRKK